MFAALGKGVESLLVRSVRRKHKGGEITGGALENNLEKNPQPTPNSLCGVEAFVQDAGILGQQHENREEELGLSEGVSSEG